MFLRTHAGAADQARRASGDPLLTALESNLPMRMARQQLVDEFEGRDVERILAQHGAAWRELLTLLASHAAISTSCARRQRSKNGVPELALINLSSWK
jgi:hypothetical protein